jgi:hypothetical protein
VAFYAEGPDGALLAFMRKTDADKYADKTKGKVLTYAEALSGVKVAATPANVASVSR